MEYIYNNVTDSEQKSAICDKVLRSLPDWFGIEEAIVEYVKDVRDTVFIAVYCGNEPVGFVSLNVHFPSCAEIHVMGILSEHHRQGIGGRLVRICEDYCLEHGQEFLTVKTLDSAHPDKYYAKTREFYAASGFKPVEVFKTLWGAANPCLFMAKSVGKPV